MIPKLTELLNWVHYPRPAEKIYDILKAMSDDDLFKAMTQVTTIPAARIAWAEWGRRKGFVDFKIGVAELEGGVEVTFAGDAKPIHTGPLLGLKS
jgi:hypothetical protein